MRHPAQGATGAWVMPGLTFKCFPLWEFSLFDTAVVMEKTLESPLDCKDIKPVHPKGYQFWVFIRRTDVETETPILWPLDVKS